MGESSSSLVRQTWHANCLVAFKGLETSVRHVVSIGPQKARYLHGDACALLELGPCKAGTKATHPNTGCTDLFMERLGE